LTRRKTIPNALHTGTKIIEYNGYLYVIAINSTVQRLYRSANEGVSWELVATDNYPNFMFNDLLGVVDGKLWFGGTHSDTGNDGLFNWNGSILVFTPVGDIMRFSRSFF